MNLSKLKVTELERKVNLVLMTTDIVKKEEAILKSSLVTFTITS